MFPPLSSRIPMALMIASATSLLFYTENSILLHWIMNVALLFDMMSTAFKVNFSIENQMILISVEVFSILANLAFLYLHQRYPQDLIEIIMVTQSSDIFQYFGGKRFGRHRIGSISPNKTYEGYLFSLVVILILWLFSSISLINLLTCWFLGIMGGLLNSIIKRKLEIKDFSHLFGEHGGFLDRADSVYLPVMAFYIWCE